MDMARLYLAAQDALRNFNPPELRTLADGQEELVAQFIHRKVLGLAGNARPSGNRDVAPTTAAAMRLYFKRFLIDRLRSAEHRCCISLETLPADEVAPPPGHGREAAPGEQSALLALLEHGLTSRQVEHAATDFIEGLDGDDRTLLVAALCRAEQASSVRTRIAAGHRIRSPHHRAARLGLVRHRQASAATDFARTRIGRWIELTLNVKLQGENRDAIVSIVDILAAVASRYQADVLHLEDSRGQPATPAGAADRKTAPSIV